MEKFLKIALVNLIGSPTNKEVEVEVEEADMAESCVDRSGRHRGVIPFMKRRERYSKT